MIQGICGGLCLAGAGGRGHLHGYGELAAAHRVPVLLGALPLLALQQVRVVADLAQDVDARQRILAVLHAASTLRRVPDSKLWACRATVRTLQVGMGF